MPTLGNEVRIRIDDVGYSSVDKVRCFTLSTLSSWRVLFWDNIQIPNALHESLHVHTNMKWQCLKYVPSLGMLP